MTGRIALSGVLLGALVAGWATIAPAEELRQQLNAPMILKLLARPVEAPETAFNEALKRDASAPRAPRSGEPEVLEDGSLKYGRGSTSVIIRNPCPPGDLAHEAAYARPLPGRARR